MDQTTLFLTIISGLGLLGGIGAGVKALVDRRTIRAQAGHDDANAAAVVAAAARELVDPLRRELQAERAEVAKERTAHLQEIESERLKVNLVRQELNAALGDVTRLHGEMSSLRATLRSTLQELEAARRRMREQDAEIAALRAAQS